MAVVKDTMPIVGKPGIYRDGTLLDSRGYFTDAVWTRFYGGRPKKMGGYRQLTNTTSGPIRTLRTFPTAAQDLVHCGSSDFFEQVLIDHTTGAFGGLVDRTPAGFVAQPENVWSIDYIYDGTGTATAVVAHAARNLLSPSNNVAAKAYIGPVSDVTVLDEIAANGKWSGSIDGGLAVIGPFLTLFGSGGLIVISEVNEPTLYSAGQSLAANPVGTKILRGMPIRGGSSAPSGLYWSEAEIIRMSFVGGTAFWNFDTLTSKSSIISAASVVEYDGVYYWIGNDRFLTFNGVMREIPNEINLEYFFNGLNRAYKGKVWGTAVGRYGEIWWFYPRGDNTECSHAVIFNVRTGQWYDTPIARSAGYYAYDSFNPVWADAIPEEADPTKSALWQHEVGTDKVVGAVQTAIPAYFETPLYSFMSTPAEANPGKNLNTRTRTLEPDFIGVSEMSVQLVTRNAPNGVDSYGEAHMFNLDEPDETENSFVDFGNREDQGRYCRLRFTSNTQNGTFLMGRPIVTIEPGDKRETAGPSSS